MTTVTTLPDFNQQLAKVANEYYYRSLRQNIIMVKKSQKMNGQKMGPVCLGYKDGAKRGEVDIEPKAAKLVKEIYNRYIFGQSQAEIVRWLNENHLDKLNSHGKQFYPSTVRRILTNTLYTGWCYGPNDELIRSMVYEPIIDDDTFLKAKNIRFIRQKK
ncbi:MAG: recombinase family protein [Lentisphaeria bacterium]|nr:recombinase family protein [Lentisphaeria bacterium]NQZ69087.1 recombinase family protein [Lentisphaeria bacterium]